MRKGSSPPCRRPSPCGRPVHPANLGRPCAFAVTTSLELRRRSRRCRGQLTAASQSPGRSRRGPPSSRGLAEPAVPRTLPLGRLPGQAGTCAGPRGERPGCQSDLSTRAGAGALGLQPKHERSTASLGSRHPERSEAVKGRRRDQARSVLRARRPSDAAQGPRGTRSFWRGWGQSPFRWSPSERLPSCRLTRPAVRMGAAMRMGAAVPKGWATATGKASRRLVPLLLPGHRARCRSLCLPCLSARGWPSTTFLCGATT